ncbi:13255_t:CDS:2, partial [Racocetra fulgida]
LRLANRRNQRKKKRAEETEEERKLRIEHECSQRQNKLNTKTPEEREERLAQEREVRLEHRCIQWSKKKAEANNEPIVESGQLSESDRNLLNTFRKIMAKTKNSAIDKALSNLQNNNNQPLIIELPKINRAPIDEFNTPGYMARAFPTLYPYGIADLYAPRIKK